MKLDCVTALRCSDVPAHAVVKLQRTVTLPLIMFRTHINSVLSEKVKHPVNQQPSAVCDTKNPAYDSQDTVKVMGVNLLLRNVSKSWMK
jgi:hypothetical protein